MSSFNTGASISQQRIEKWTNEISDMIRDARQAAVLGKTEWNSDVLARKIIFKKWASYEYMADATSLKKWEQTQWFEGDKNYSIENIEISQKPISPTENNYAWTVANELYLSFENEKKYAWNNSTNLKDSNIVSYRITLNYKGLKRYIFWSVYSGNVEIWNQPD